MSGRPRARSPRTRGVTTLFFNLADAAIPRLARPPGARYDAPQQSARSHRAIAPTGPRSGPGSRKEELMITRTTRLGLLAATLAIVASACSGSATPTPAPSVAAPSVAPSVATSAAPSVAASPSPAASTSAGANLKIGVVTDLGTLNDKGFNEYSY